MKKRNIIIITILGICIILFTLCLFLFDVSDDKYKNYEHFNIEKYDNIKYTFENDNMLQTYAIAHLNNGEDERDALFYKLSDNDYIFITEVGSGDAELDFESNYFYKDTETNKNKLYVHRATWPSIIEYTLNEEKIEEKSLNFDLSKISKNSKIEDINKIEKIEDNYIYFEANILENNNDVSINIIDVKCSLKDYICIEN